MRVFRFSTQSKNFAPKFYKNAYCPSETAPFSIYLDKSQLKSPNKHIINCPSKILALSICEEFNSQKEYINTIKMPLFGMCRTAIDAQYEELVRQNLIERILQFFSNDTIFYWEDQETKLGKIQKEELQPVFDYMNQHLKLKLTPLQGFSFEKPVDENQIASLKEMIKDWDSFKLTSFEMLCSLFKSASISLMLLQDQLTVDKAIQLSMLEENYQIEKFGFVEGGHDLDIGYIRMMSYSAKIFYDFSQCK